MKNINDILTLDKNAETKHFKKGEILQRDGVRNSYAYFVQKGLLRSYTIDNKGKEHIFMFASEGWIISDNETVEFSMPNKIFIDCIENSEVIMFNKNRLKEMELTSEQLKEQNHKLLRRIGVLQKRVIMLMSATAEERYNSFLETYPELPNRVAQRMIASYLGITPQALSTIRGKIVRKL